MEKVKRAALYTRVSREEQVLHGLSLDVQLEVLKRYVASHEMVIADVYTDEGISARKHYKKRPEFVRLLNDAQAGKFDVILFIKLDRWFRNVGDYYEVQRILDSHNVQWIATEEDYNTTTTNGQLMLNLKLAIAQNEADQTRDRINFVFAQKKEKGEALNASPAFGYDIVNKHYVPNQDAEIVKALYNHYLQSGSLSETVKWFSAQYHSITYRSIQKYLTNPVYIGTIHGYPNLCEAIIDEDTFKVVQAMVQNRAQRNASSSHSKQYLFTGLIFCSHCGAAMHAERTNIYTYYRCRSNREKNTCNHRKRIREEYIEHWILDNIESELNEYNVTAKLRQKQTQKVSPDKIKKKLSRLKDLYIDDKIDRETYDADYAVLKAQLDEIEASQVPLLPIKTLPNDWKETYLSLDTSRKKAFLNRVILRIEVDQDNGLKLLLR